MPIETIPYPQSPLGFLLDDGDSLSVSLIEVTTEELDGALDRVEVTFLVSPSDYARVDAEAVFHLTPEVRGPGSQRGFRDDAPIEIEARLHPHYLILLKNETETLDEIGDYLLTLSGDDANHALLSADSWYALRVKQEELLPPELQGPGRSLKSGYSTTWNETLTNEERLTPALRTLIETLTGEGWNWSLGAEPSTVMSRLWTDDPEDRWTVYSQIRDDEHFCLIYGVCPVRFSTTQLPQIIEFISRANQDLPIGNFEVNEDTLEIRFKTSLDYEGSDLTQPIVRQLLRANAAMMERYLPSLHALLEDHVSMAEALRLAEE